MTALNRNPPNTNYLQSTKFQIIFPRISSVTYFCRSVNVPGLSSTPVVQTTPFVDLYKPGDKTLYETLDIEFIVDEELWSWQVIHDWIRKYSFPCSFEEYKTLDRESIVSMKSVSPQYSDAYLSTLTGLNNFKVNLKFVDVFPISLSGINMSSTQSADDIITAKATFKYQLYNFERI